MVQLGVFGIILYNNVEELQALKQANEELYITIAVNFWWMIGNLIIAVIVLSFANPKNLSNLKLILFIRDIFLHAFALYFMLLYFGLTATEKTKAVSEMSTEDFGTIISLVQPMVFYRFINFSIWFLVLLMLAILYAIPAQRPMVRKMMGGQDQDGQKDKTSLHHPAPTCGLCFEDFEHQEVAAQIQCKDKHLFKPEMLSDWLNHEKQLKCPTCEEQPFSLNQSAVQQASLKNGGDEKGVEMI